MFLRPIHSGSAEAVMAATADEAYASQVGASSRARQPERPSLVTTRMARRLPDPEIHGPAGRARWRPPQRSELRVSEGGGQCGPLILRSAVSVDARSALQSLMRVSRPTRGFTHMASTGPHRPLTS